MAIVASNSDATQEILKVLGLEGKHVYEFHLHMFPNEPVSIDVKRWIEGDELREIKNVLTRYHITEVGTMPLDKEKKGNTFLSEADQELYDLLNESD